MLRNILISMGLAKPKTHKVKLPKGLKELEVVSAKAWWN